jgi:hypothetical protein
MQRYNVNPPSALVRGQRTPYQQQQSAMDGTETGLLALIFQNANYANVGDATGLRGSSTAGVFWISLHTANPGANEATGTQTTSEAAYTSYGRQSVNRASGAGGWTVTGNTADNTSQLNFPAATGGSETETHYGIGFNQTTAGTLNFWGALGAGLAVSNGITPYFAAGALDVTLD